MDKLHVRLSIFLFFFNDTATTEIYTLSLHDALPISTLLSKEWAAQRAKLIDPDKANCDATAEEMRAGSDTTYLRSEEHTSELQSRLHLVCRLLLEKKKRNTIQRGPDTSLPVSFSLRF